jgi:hypothetical protein
MGAFAVGGYVLWYLIIDRAKLRPLVLMSVPVGLALIPIFWMTLQTPSVGENSLKTVTLSVMDVLPRRGTIFWAPFLFATFAPLLRSYFRPTMLVFAASIALVVMIATGPLRISYGSYYGALHFSDDIYAAYFQSPQFHPGATYRVVEPNGREDGMYYFIRHGAVLSNEFFSESEFFHSFPKNAYPCFLSFRRVDYVVMERAYMANSPSNEQSLLQGYVASGQAQVAYVDPEGKFTVYDVRPFVAAQPKPSSLDQCGMW